MPGAGSAYSFPRFQTGGGSRLCRARRNVHAETGIRRGPACRASSTAANPTGRLTRWRQRGDGGQEPARAAPGKQHNHLLARQGRGPPGCVGQRGRATG